jgi:NitT/TauT family transport system substrate-binding protein
MALAGSAFSQSNKDVVRLGNLKFAHYGAVSYMKEIGPRYNLEIKEQIFAKGLDIMPAIISGSIDVSASALDAAIAGRAGGAPIYVVAGFSKGGGSLAVPIWSCKKSQISKEKRSG